jgi:Tol biopolymer transport system component
MKMFMRIHINLSVFIIALLCISSTGTAQFFGKNKVQYDDFNWHYIQSDHFDVYFSDGGKQIAEFTAKASEDALILLQNEFRYEITNRIPMIIYNSANDFQQTNVVGVYLEEGIGGVTELFKNRVVLPFTGSYSSFRHVIHHELVHAVLNDMFYGGSLQAAIANQVQLQLPLWLNEGMAEYQSLGGWDTNSDMFIRDAATSNYLPPIQYLGGYFAYRGGQSVWWYISEKYGKQKVGEILNRIRTTRSVNKGFKTAIGLDLKELSERWMKEQKVMYWPDIATRVSPEDYAKRLTDHVELGNFYNTSPAISPAGDKIAFISNRDDFYSIWLMSTTEEKDAELIVEGQTSSDFEDLNLLTPGISWSPDGKYIAFAGKAGGSDAINIVEVESGDHEKLDIQLEGIQSVSWSPNGDMVAFVGITASQSDIWVFHIKSKQSTRLTSDLFSDETPSWSPDSKFVYFASDRKEFISIGMLPGDFDIYDHDYSQKDLYRVNVESKIVERLTSTADVAESNPVVSPDATKMMYLSDENGISNFYIRELETGESYPITNSLSGVYQFTISRDGNKLAFASMFEAGFDIFMLKNPFAMDPVEDLEPTEFLKRKQKEQELLSLSTGSDGLPADESPETRELNEEVEIVLGEQESNVDSTFKGTDQNRILFGSDARNIAKSKKSFSRPKDNLAADGSYKVNKYKLSFSPDLVYGNAGYSTFYGVLGTTTMAFSDMLGNHQIIFLTNLLGDLKNSDYALAYYYLPDRIDWGIQGFHSARFLYSATSQGEFLYRYRQFGGGISASYPIDRYYRIDGGLTYMNISQENLDVIIPTSETTVLLPSLGFVHDNTLWGGWSPAKGTRYEIQFKFLNVRIHYL